MLPHYYILGAILIERVASVQEGFSQEAPYVCSFGHKAAEANTTLFNILCKQIATGVKEKLETSKKVKSSGVIINTCGWIKGNGYKHLTQIAQTFEVDIILVLGQERLYNELVRDMPNFVKVVYLPKSGGVVERSQSTRIESRDQRIREYFYGTSKCPIYPHSFDMKWSEVKMYKIGAPALPDSCLPLGMKADDHLTKVVPLTPNAGMLHHLFAVSYASKEDEVITSYVAGFVCITNIDIERQLLTFLAPQPKPLPSNILLWCELQFMDSQ